MLLTPLQKLTKNVEDLGKLLDAKGLKKLPKAQKIAQSGHTARKIQGDWIPSANFNLFSHTKSILR